MLEPTPLERAALDAILDELADDRAELEVQLLQASVVERENTGGGFFTELALHGEVPVQFQGRHLGDEIWIAVEGMSHGLGMILHLDTWRAPLLEGYAVGPENTMAIDFERAAFSLVAEPGSLNK